MVEIIGMNNVAPVSVSLLGNAIDDIRIAGYKITKTKIDFDNQKVILIVTKEVAA